MHGLIWTTLICFSYFMIIEIYFTFTEKEDDLDL